MANEFTDQEALDLLLTLLSEKAPELEVRARLSIDAGVDDEEQQILPPSKGRKRQSSTRSYRKHRTMTDLEGIRAVLIVLEAHLVTYRLAINSAVNDMTNAAAFRGNSNDFDMLEQTVDLASNQLIADRPQVISVELEPETVRQTPNLSVVDLQPTEHAQIMEVKALIDAIRSIVGLQAGN